MRMAKKFEDAVRNMLYVLECPLRVITEGAHISKATLYDVTHGRTGRRSLDISQRLTKALCTEADKQIAYELRKVENLKRLKAELIEALKAECEGGAANGS